MKKKNIIFIACAITVLLIIAVAVYFVVTNNKSENLNSEQKIIIEKYNENFEVEKTIEITDEKQIKEITKICENPSLEQDDTSPYLAIKNDIKLDLGNGKFFMIQADLQEYCYYEDASSNTKLVIKMPEGLFDIVNNILLNSPQESVNSTNHSSTKLSKVIINTYKINSLEPTDSITVQDKEKIFEITTLVSKISKLSEDEYVDLALLTDIEIVIDNSVSVSLQKSTPNYCHYNNTDSGESYLAKTPNGLFDLINDII